MDSLCTRSIVVSSLALALALAGCKNTRPGSGVGEEACIPGETLIIGCAAECGLGSCEGFTRIRVCDGALGRDECADAAIGMYVQFDGNTCGGTTSGSRCPRGRITCPPSGSVIIAPTGTFDDWSCNWAVDHRGILPPGGRAGETVACTPGEIYAVGCAQNCGLGECEGSPSMRICDGTLSVTECADEGSTTLESGTSFRSCGCPYRVVRCPASGQMTIAPRTTGDQICEWDVRNAPHRPNGTEICSPGQRIAVGCAGGCGLGACEAETYLRVCEGETTPELCALDSASYLAESGMASCDDDCPQVVVSCPGSGAVTVVTRGWGEDEPYACDWGVRAAGIGE